MTVSIEVDTNGDVRVGAAESLFADTYDMDIFSRGIPNYDVSADGQRFLMVSTDVPDSGPRTITLVDNWFEELKRLVPID